LLPREQTVSARLLGWTDAVAELGKLLSIEMLKEESSPVCARITTNAGCHLYAFSWEHIEPDLACR
jgi:hypothetical protein